MLIDVETGAVLQAGTRVTEVALDDGTVIVTGGAVVAGQDLTVATIDFLARGGDQYPYRGAAFTSVGVSYQQALSSYIQAPSANGGLDGLISSTQYPEGGAGRITQLP
jgi:5'-nucleotidase